MPKTTMNLQDLFLNYVRKEKIKVTVNLLSGAKVVGRVKGFDNFAIFIKNSVDELIYKHAVMSIVPERDIKALRDIENRHTG